MVTHLPIFTVYCPRAYSGIKLIINHSVHSQVEFEPSSVPDLVLLSFAALLYNVCDCENHVIKGLTMKIHTIERKVEGFSDSQRFAYVRYRPQAYLKRCQSLDSWTYVLKTYLRRRLQLQYGFNSQCKKVCDY